MEIHESVCPLLMTRQEAMGLARWYLQQSLKLLAMIALSVVESSAQTVIHNAILLIDTSNNVSCNQAHWLIRTPYLSIIASNEICLYVCHTGFWLAVEMVTSFSHLHLQAHSSHRRSWRKYTFFIWSESSVLQRICVLPVKSYQSISLDLYQSKI